MRAHLNLPTLSAIALTSLATALVSAQSQTSGPQTTFSATSELVSTTLSVTDKEGRFIPDLKPSDLRVYEDGVLQKVSIFVPVIGGQRLPSLTTTDEAVSTPVRREGLI